MEEEFLQGLSRNAPLLDYSRLAPSSEIQTQASSYSVSYSHNSPNLCCTCDEIGNIYLVSISDYNEISSINPHNNSIFHVGWSLDDKYILSGSGDQTGGVWDIERDTGSILSKHKGSVKCIRNTPGSFSIYSTASRDGKIYLWDLRVKGTQLGRNTKFDPIGEISQESEIKSRKKQDPVSFTGIEYLPWGNIIVSVQANEAEMRFWDVRKYSSVKEPKSKNSRKGYLGKVGPWTYAQDKRLEEISGEKGAEKVANLKTQMKIQEAGPGNSWVCRKENSLLVSSVGNCLYYYRNLLRIDTEEPVKFLGHKGSFYVKGCIGPEGDMVASGSSDGSLYIWDVLKPDRPLVVQTGYESELGCVDWTFGSEKSIATSLDSAIVLLWDIDGL